MKKYMIFVTLIIISALLSAGCTSKIRQQTGISLPEADRIQALLNSQSEALIQRDADKFAEVFSDACPQKQETVDLFRASLKDVVYTKYSQTLVSAARMQDCVICSVEIRFEANAADKVIKKQVLREIAFIYETGNWRILDNSYHPYTNPTVIVGSDSLLQDAAAAMSEALSASLFTDKTHLQTSGDIILIGTAYDNASILEFENGNLTHIKVTEDYPGDEIGVVQVLSGVEGLRHALVIQSSSTATAEKTVDYMTHSLLQNPYMVPGVYFYEEDRLRKASLLEMNTLATLDIEKTEERIREVQDFTEANIALLQAEVDAERNALRKSTGKHTSPKREDFHEAFSRYQNAALPHSTGMLLINANLADPVLCANAFQLPQGSSAGVLYAVSSNDAGLYTGSREENRLLSYSQNSAHRLTAQELQRFAAYPGSLLGSNEDKTAYYTALLRLAGFSEEEVFSVIQPETAGIFCRIGSGYALDPDGAFLYHMEKHPSAEEILAVENEGSYIRFKDSDSNLDILQIQETIQKLHSLYKLKRQLPEYKAGLPDAITQDLTAPVYLPYGTNDIFELLRDIFIERDMQKHYATLSEARAKLRETMGLLLSLKCSSFLKDTAALYPGSQFDYARYAAGFTNVAYPEVYAEGAERSRLIERLYGGIGRILDSQDQRLEKLLAILSEIKDIGEQADKLTFPDFCLWNRSGTPADKALAAYGIYKKLMGGSRDAYVVIGENSAYLAFERDAQWFFLDCRDNQVKDYLSDTVLLAFDSRQSYRPEEEDEQPEFM